MIKIEDKKIEFKGSAATVIAEYIRLTHAFIDGVFPKIPKDVKNMLKCALTNALQKELGMEFLVKCGLMNDFQLLDISKMEQLFENEGGKK